MRFALDIQPLIFCLPVCAKLRIVPSYDTKQSIYIAVPNHMLEALSCFHVSAYNRRKKLEFLCFFSIFGHCLCEGDLPLLQ